MATPWSICRAGWAVLLVGTLLSLLTGFANSGEADEPSDSSADAAFFTAKIGPLLATRCQECHGPDEQKGGLRLDSRAAALQGGDTGPALVPGDAEQSLLIDAVRYGPTYRMPPTGRLPPGEVELLVEWVRRGAPWPESGAATPPIAQPPMAGEDPRHAPHWAFQPPQPPALPEVRGADWPRRPVDQFILARLEAAGLQPSVPAARHELLRRVTYDLTGLPPTPAERAEFLADDAPEAWPRLVDRLLASPRYGQRWGRHWLDVARYADSNGMDENLAHGNAWRYRDWVIDAFNADLPYDEFVRQQIAGDLLPAATAPDRARQLIATGFLTIGPKMLAEDDPQKLEMDVIDEQLDTLGSAVLGMTFGCARCHDHKFDPISMADYYALAGVFKSTQTMESLKVVARWHERPLASVEEESAWAERHQEVQRRRDAIAARKAEATKSLGDELRGRALLYLTAAVECVRSERQRPPAAPAVEPRPDAIVIEAERFDAGNVRRDFEVYGAGIGVIYNQGPLPNSAEYAFETPSGGAFELNLRYAAAESRPTQVWIDDRLVRLDAAGDVTGSWHVEGQQWRTAAIVRLAPGRHTLRLLRHGPFPHFDKLALVPLGDAAGALPMTPERCVLDRNLRRAALDRWLAALRAAAADSSLAALLGASETAEAPAAAVVLQWTLDQAAIWQALLEDPQGPAAVPAEPDNLFADDMQRTLADMKAELAAAEAEVPTLPMTMAVAEGQPQNLRIHVRGSHWTQTDEVPRRFPAALHAFTAALPSDRSGRQELAQWLTAADHPLTARVLVNRVWRWRFGAGLVNSTDNFGLLGQRPSHPELLDWLALRLVEQGWSIKRLHRELLLSASYQQSSQSSVRATQFDPERRLWQHMPRRRLEAEALRDAILAVSGTLDESPGGSLLTAKNREYVAGTASVNLTRYDSSRRSVYLPVVRSALYEVFQAFDFADPSVPNGDRQATTVAPQGLFVLNSPLVDAAAAAWARELLAGEYDDAQRVTQAFLAAYCRPPSDDQRAAALAFLAQERALAEAAGDAITGDAADERAWQALCRVLLGASEFSYMD